MTNFEFISWLMTISFGLTLIIYMFRFIKLKEEIAKLMSKNVSLRYVINEKEVIIDSLHKRLSTKNSVTQLSKEDIKSLINIIHPDKQPENRKQRANELFIKLRSLQN